MNLYVYPDGEIHEEAVSYKSDDFTIIDSYQPIISLAKDVDTAFGDTQQARTVLIEILELDVGYKHL